jgi:hypothetical protein
VCVSQITKEKDYSFFFGSVFLQSNLLNMISTRENIPNIDLGLSHFKWKLVIFFAWSAFTIYLTFSFSTIPNELLSQPLSICFLIFIILRWGSMVRNLVEIRFIAFYVGKMMTRPMWDNILPFQRHRLVSLYLSCSSLLSVGTCAYFISIFIPIEDDRCDIYSDVPYACSSLKLISFFSMFAFCIAVLFVLLGLMLHHCQTPPSEYGDCVIDILRNILNQFPIPRVVVDTRCGVCFQQCAVDKPSKTLTCQCKFHPKCINEWLEIETICPKCRANVPLSEL